MATRRRRGGRGRSNESAETVSAESALVNDTAESAAMDEGPVATPAAHEPPSDAAPDGEAETIALPQSDGETTDEPVPADVADDADEPASDDGQRAERDTNRGEGRQGREGRPRGEGRPERDDRPRGDARPEREDRPRSEGRAEREDRPRGEGRAEREDRPRGEGRPERDERPRGEGRPERDERPRGEGRPERSRDERPRQERARRDGRDERPRAERRPESREERPAPQGQSRARRIAVIHGPNLNLLGTREPKVYGTTTLAEIDQSLQDLASDLGAQVSTFQSAREGALIEHIHSLRGRCDGIVINAAGYSHTSIALRDALIAVAIPFVEVHVSNVYARESFRHKSVLADVARGVIVGFGALSYELALGALLHEG